MAKTTRSFKYQRRSADSVKERANARGGGFDTYIKPEFKLYKIRDGKNLIRILPPTWEGAKHYGYDIYLVYGIGPDNQSYLSLSKMKGEKDPMDEARRTAQRENDEETVKALQPRQRILMWIIDRLDEDEGPQLFSCPFTLDKDIAAICFDDDTKECIYLDDPKEGCDLRFYKEGEGLKTKYPAAKMKLSSASSLIDDDQLYDDWLGFVQENPIPNCLQFYDYDHISRVFDGEEPSAKSGKRDRDDDVDEKPRSRRAVKEDDVDEDEKPKRKPARDEDEADEKPARRARATATDEEDDETEDKPRKRAASKPEDEDEDDEVEAAEPKGGSLRDRLKQRRQASSKSSDEDE